MDESDSMKREIKKSEVGFVMDYLEKDHSIWYEPTH